MAHTHEEVTLAIMDAAAQLLVADRLRYPREQAREPLDKKEASAYVREAAFLFIAASDLVKSSQLDK